MNGSNNRDTLKKCRNLGSEVGSEHCWHVNSSIWPGALKRRNLGSEQYWQVNSSIWPGA